MGFFQNTCGFTSDRSPSCGRPVASRRIAATARGTVSLCYLSAYLSKNFMDVSLFKVVSCEKSFLGENAFFRNLFYNFFPVTVETSKSDQNNIENRQTIILNLQSTRSICIIRACAWVFRYPCTPENVSYVTADVKRMFVEGGINCRKKWTIK